MPSFILATNLPSIQCVLLMHSHIFFLTVMLMKTINNKWLCITPVSIFIHYSYSTCIYQAHFCVQSLHKWFIWWDTNVFISGHWFAACLNCWELSSITKIQKYAVLKTENILCRLAQHLHILLIFRRYHLYWQRLSVIFLSPSRQMLDIYHDYFSHTSLLFETK